jgi:hypothetical protein
MTVETLRSDGAVIAESLKTPAVFGAIFDRHFDAIHAYLQRQIGRDRAVDLAGRVVFLDENPPATRPKFEVSPLVAIHWGSVPQQQREAELVAEGFAWANTRYVEMSKPIPSAGLPFDYLRFKVNAYVARESPNGWLSAVALWHEGGQVFELHLGVPSLYKLWLIAQRVETLATPEWVIALKPGGGAYLAETVNGLARGVEHVKIGEKPNGEPIYQDQGLIGSRGTSEEFKPQDLTIVYREGDKVRVVVMPPPE